MFTIPETLVRNRGLTENEHISVFGEMNVQQRIALNQLQKSGKPMPEIIGKCSKHVVFIIDNIDQHGMMLPNLLKDLPLDEQFRIFEYWGARDNETCKTIYFHLDDDYFITAFALIHKTDFDPFKRHRRPHVIDFIYTLQNHRRRGHARMMLQYIKQHYETTAFVISDDGRSLFSTCDFQLAHVTIRRQLTPAYRYP